MDSWGTSEGANEGEGEGVAGGEWEVIILGVEAGPEGERGAKRVGWDGAKEGEW